MSEALSHATYLNRHYFGSLDAIRAVAILGVVWHHTTQPFAALPITSRGFLGVDLFFVLSGFLIVTLLLRERDRTNAISLRGFYMRRTLRIFPVYYGLLLALTLLFGFVARDSDMAAPFFAALPYYLTYTSNFIREETLLAIAWSLAAEEQFYLIWPPIEKYLRRYSLPILGLLLLVNQLINFRLILVAQHAQLEILQSTFTPILLGVLLAHLLHNPRGYARAAQLLGNRWTVVLIGVALLLFVNLFALGSDISGWPRLTIHLLITLFIAACVVREDHALQGIMRWRPVVRIGTISYGMYLFHAFAVEIMRVVLSRVGLDDPLLLFVTSLIVTVIIAEVSYRFYETPFLKLKDRLSRQMATRRSRAVAS